MINLETELGAWKWNFYRANKTFLQFPGLFASTKPLDEKPGSLESLKIMRMRKTISTTEYPAIRQISVYDPALLESCYNDASCVGMELPTHRLLSYLDLDSLRKVPGITTMVKALAVDGDTNIDSRNSRENLDTCCPKSGKVTDALVAKIDDHLERVSCDIPQKVIS